MNGHYDTSQICRNGHVINSYVQKYPDHGQEFCSLCGQPTLTKCESCNTPIRGSYVYHGPIVDSDYQTPNYCYACGKPYPWTMSKLDAAQDLVAELEGLNAQERQLLKQSLYDLVAENPRTEVAGLRFKKLMRKVGAESYEAVKNVVSDLVSETIKKTIFG